MSQHDADPPIVFFVDISLGARQIPAALRAAGEQVEVHNDYFGQGTADVDWIPFVGQRGWVVLTKDRNLGTNVIEIMAIYNANLAVFSLSNANMNGAAMAAALVGALPQMRQTAAHQPRPFVAKVLRDASVRMWLTTADLQRRAGVVG